jgi:adenine-specific DNA-methyltransferase
LSKRDYSSWTKDELILEVEHLGDQKKFGLIWEDQFEDQNTNLTKHIPVLKELRNLACLMAPGRECNLIIEGDNLHSLTILNYTHFESIDLIYIDPPYNTGKKDFIYNDNFVAEDDSYRHSKWLSFISRRLLLAKSLLTYDGVIFVSIGTDEVHRLRLLMEDVFGEQNFIACVTRVQKAGSDQGTHFAPSVDYVLVFAKDKTQVSPFSQFVTEEYVAGFNKADPSGSKYKEKGLFQASLDPMRGCINQRYFIEAPDGSLCIPPGDVLPQKKVDGEQTPPKTKADKVWRWSRDRYLQEKNNIIFKKTKKSPLIDENGNPSPWNVYTKQYLDEEKGALPRDFFEKYDNSQGTVGLKQLGLEFTFAKPVWLIADLLEITGKKNAKVLDFFAGSGTTGQAVLELNRLDGGRRTFILCTNNEEDIATNITQPRIARVISGYAAPKYDPFVGIPSNMRYFKVDSISNSTTDSNKALLTKEAAAMLSIREGCFEEISSNEGLLIFAGVDSRLAILFDFDSLHELKLEIESHPETLYRVYVFSLANEDLSGELEAYGERIVSLPVPEGILNTYFRSLSELKRR